MIERGEYLRAVCHDCGQSAIFDLERNADQVTTLRRFEQLLVARGWSIEGDVTRCQPCAFSKQAVAR